MAYGTFDSSYILHLILTGLILFRLNVQHVLPSRILRSISLMLRGNLIVEHAHSEHA